MKTRKTLLMVLSLVLVAVVSVAGTLAYLTKTTGSITNTFTVGNVDIALSELKLKDDKITPDTEKGIIEGGNQEYKVAPGQTITSKDGIVTVKAGSEDCWVFVKIAETDSPDLLTVAVNEAWTLVTGETDVYAYAKVTDVDADVDLTRVIDSVTISDAVEKAEDLEGHTIVLTAYAIQAEGLADADAAWAALNQ